MDYKKLLIIFPFSEIPDALLRDPELPTGAATRPARAAAVRSSLKARSRSDPAAGRRGTPWIMRNYAGGRESWEQDHETGFVSRGAALATWAAFGVKVGIQGMSVAVLLIMNSWMYASMQPDTRC